MISNSSVMIDSNKWLRERRYSRLSAVFGAFFWERALFACKTHPPYLTSPLKHFLLETRHATLGIRTIHAPVESVTWSRSTTTKPCTVGRFPTLSTTASPWNPCSSSGARPGSPGSMTPCWTVFTTQTVHRKKIIFFSCQKSVCSVYQSTV